MDDGSPCEGLEHNEGLDVAGNAEESIYLYMSPIPAAIEGSCWACWLFRAAGPFWINIADASILYYCIFGSLAGKLSPFGATSLS